MTARGKIGWLIPLGVVLSALIGAVLVWSWRQASTAADLVTHTSDVRAAAFELRSHILGAEIEERDELLSGEVAPRERFESETKLVFDDLHRLRALTRDNPKQLGHLQGLGRLATTFFEQLRAAMDTRDRDGLDAALEQTGAATTDDIAGQIRERLDAVIAEEDVLLAQRQHRSSSMDFYALLELVGASIVLGTIGTYAFQQGRTVRIVDDERRRFEAIFQNATDAMLLYDADLVVRDANAATADILGLGHDQIVGRAAPALAPAVEPEAWRRAYHGHTRLERPSRVIDITTTPDVLDGLHLAVLRDVTRRARVEEARRVLVEASAVLASSTTEEEVLSKLAHVVVQAFGEECRVGVADGAGLRVIAEARSASSAAPSEERTRSYLDDMRRVLATGRGARAGSVLVAPICAGPRAAGVLLLASPKSERRYDDDDLAVAEDLGRRAGMAIEQIRALARERDANRAKDEFLATVSHELRTPLTAILGWSRMLPTLPASDAKKGVATIERNATALARLVDDVLDVSRIITGKLQIAQEPLDLGEVLRAALRVVEPTARAKDIALESHVGECPFYGDAGRLQQVFWNLLSNAIKFTPPGGHVTCTLEREGATVRVLVRDTGRGIEPSFLPFAFDRFRQHDSSTTRVFGGLGLGLAIVRHLVEMHGGTVHAESDGKDRGATFVVELPVRAVAAEAPPRREEPVLEPAERRAGESRPLQGVNVLVCDDDEDARWMVCAVLEHAGAKVEAVDSAKAALAAVRAHPPNVLVSDIGMPGEDGYSLMRRVRGLDPAQGGEVPAIALTAYATSADVSRAIDAGFQEHVAKPVDPRALVDKLASLTGAARP